MIAAKTDRISNKVTQGAQAAATKAQTTPATAQEALNATTADVNRDGFVTLDEVIAMKQAGLSDETRIQRLRATDQVFELTDDQKTKVAELEKEFGPKMKELREKLDKVLTEEQQKARAAVLKDARTSGKKGKELHQAVKDSLRRGIEPLVIGIVGRAAHKRFCGLDEIVATFDVAPQLAHSDAQ